MTRSLYDAVLKRRMKPVQTDRYVIDLNMPKEYPPIKARKTEEGGVRDRFFASVAELPNEITVVRPFDTECFPESSAKSIYVAADGCDCAEGSKEAPLATINEAVKRAAGKGGAKIVLRGGEYIITEPIDIGAEHSGTETSPFIIKSEEGEQAYLSGSVSIPVGAFTKLTDEKRLAKLSEDVRDKVVVADLTALGITDLGSVVHPAASLYVNGATMTLAQYPNKGEERIPMSENVISKGLTDEEPWELGLTDERCLSWEQTDDMWLYGTLYLEWEHEYTKIACFDAEKKSMRGIGRYSRAGINWEAYNCYYYLNIFEEMDVPGEWFLDRKEGKLYLIPPCGELKEDDMINFAVAPQPMFRCRGAENFIIDRLDCGRSIGNCVSMHDCRYGLVQRCHFTGVSSSRVGETAVVDIDGGFRNGIIDSVIEYFGIRAAAVHGGDRKELIPSNNFIQNCKVINPLVRFGLDSGGVGNIVSHNYLHNTTIGDGGHNEGIIEYNIGEGGDTETHDTGMIYVAGGGCSSCANHYRYNYFFNFAKGDYGIYFDDLSRGMYAYGNIVVGNGTTGPLQWESGGRGYNHHNGGEHVYWNNISIDAGYFAFGGDISYWIRPESHWTGFFAGIYGTAKEMGTEKYWGRNPTYRDFCEAVFQYHEDQQDPEYFEFAGWAERRLRLPWCNHYENNVIVRAARPFKLDFGYDTATGLRTNYITQDDPGFVDFDGCDYRIRPDAPLYDKIPDFVPIPYEKMGPVDDYADEE